MTKEERRQELLEILAERRGIVDIDEIENDTLAELEELYEELQPFIDEDDDGCGAFSFD
ncbi:hypothetical protein [Selenomonas sp. KH1T6]|uniref:hypothetical protein n=1 Tax=Selenomonas sp. KH1T6 TaxID=3158784 RepID=UPI0008A78493|nr:hypothetical protein SAMN05216583_1424 [Selenomonas ruminantium]